MPTTVARRRDVVRVFHNHQEGIATVIHVEPVGIFRQQGLVKRKHKAVGTEGIAPVVPVAPGLRQVGDQAGGDADRKGGDHTVRNDGLARSVGITECNRPPTPGNRLRAFHVGAKPDLSPEATDFSNHRVVKILKAGFEKSK